jgi:hypothetical protein
MPNEDNIARRAVKIVMEYETKNNREPVDMQTNSKFKGFDVLSFSKDKKDIRAIEVKGTAVEGWGIPDLYENELTRSGKLVATHLYLVKFKPNTKEFEKLFIIPASEFKLDDFEGHIQYAIKSNFYTRNKIKDKLDKFEVKT